MSKKEEGRSRGWVELIIEDLGLEGGEEVGIMVTASRYQVKNRGDNIRETRGSKVRVKKGYQRHIKNWRSRSQFLSLHIPKIRPLY